MAKVKFTVACVAYYQSSLKIPKKIVNDEDAILDYIHSHLNECNIESDLERGNNLNPEEAVTALDIMYVETK